LSTPNPSIACRLEVRFWHVADIGAHHERCPLSPRELTYASRLEWSAYDPKPNYVSMDLRRCYK